MTLSASLAEQRRLIEAARYPFTDHPPLNGARVPETLSKEAYAALQALREQKEQGK
jgi:hypothetical protein